MTLTTKGSDSGGTMPGAISRRTVSARILYVDDEDAQTYLGKRMLTRLGHRVTTFNDPAAALAAIRSQPNGYDLMITDMSMPQLTGLELLREVRALRADLPVIMTSGYVRPEEEAAARALDVKELIAKPVVQEDLCRALDRLLNSS